MKLSFLRHSLLTVLVSAVNDMAQDSRGANINNQNFNPCASSQRTENFLFQRLSTAHIYPNLGKSRALMGSAVAVYVSSSEIKCQATELHENTDLNLTLQRLYLRATE